MFGEYITTFHTSSLTFLCMTPCQPQMSGHFSSSPRIILSHSSVQMTIVPHVGLADGTVDTE